MTPKEVATFALVLSEGDKARARIAEDEKAERLYDFAFQESQLEAAEQINLPTTALRDVAP